MNIKTKPIITFMGGVLIASVALSQEASAQLVSGETIHGTTILADKEGVTTPPEALTVNWMVADNAGVFTYTYDIFNPPGDMVLPPNSGDETVDSFALTFGGDVTGGPHRSRGQWLHFNLYTYGWCVLDLSAASGVPDDSYSGDLTFQSDQGPSVAAVPAEAQDHVDPSPWKSVGDIPVPGNNNYPVPDSTSTMELLSGAALFLISARRVLNSSKTA